MDCLITIDPIESAMPSAGDLIGALLIDMGCGVGGYEAEHSKAYSDDWEWFDPSKMGIRDYLDLPEHWQSLVRNMNRECWRLGYRYVHAPEDIICRYPKIPCKGIFAVIGDNAIPETVKAKDLMHLGGEFVEYNTKDAGIWRDYAEEKKEVENAV